MIKYGDTVKIVKTDKLMGGNVGCKGKVFSEVDTDDGTVLVRLDGHTFPTWYKIDSLAIIGEAK